MVFCFLPLLPVPVRMFVDPFPVSRCFMGPSSAADAALFLETVCYNVALVRCVHLVFSMGPGSAAPAAVLFLGWRHTANGVPDSVFAIRFVGSVP